MNSRTKQRYDKCTSDKLKYSYELLIALNCDDDDDV